MASLFKSFFLSFFKAFATQWLADFLILAGLAVIIWTTYTINVFVGNYLLGSTLLLIGILVAKSK